MQHNDNAARGRRDPFASGKSPRPQPIRVHPRHAVSLLRATQLGRRHHRAGVALRRALSLRRHRRPAGPARKLKRSGMATRNGREQVGAALSRRFFQHQSAGYGSNTKNSKRPRHHRAPRIRIFFGRRRSGAKSAEGRNSRCVFGSTAIVRAPNSVATVSTRENFSALSSCTTASVPSPLEANASLSAGSNFRRRCARRIGNVARIFPESASSTRNDWLRHATKIRRVAGSSRCRRDRGRRERVGRGDFERARVDGDDRGFILQRIVDHALAVERGKLGAASTSMVRPPRRSSRRTR